MTTTSQTEIVNRYLAALKTSRPRGINNTKRWMEELDIARKCSTDDGLTPVERLQAIQSAMELEERIAKRQAAEDAANDEKWLPSFVEVGAEWAARNNITYQALRQFGVTSDVLKAAGIEP